MVWQFGGIAGGGRLAIEARVEDGLDAAVAAGAVCDGAGAGGLQPLRADLTTEPHRRQIEALRAYRAAKKEAK